MLPGKRCFVACSKHLRCGYLARRIRWSSTQEDSTKSTGLFITTPIFYVNAKPHIGHLHSILLADALKRFHQLQGKTDIIFSTGTDEHGLKIQNAAEERQMEAKMFCDEVSESFKNLAKTFASHYTRFIRTTDQDHIKLVQDIWSKLFLLGHIYQSKYEGWYSVADETFVGSSQTAQVVVKGQKVMINTETGNQVEWTNEDNYMFKLKKFIPQVRDWLLRNPSVVYPQKFYDLTLKMLNSIDSDLSISRPSNRLSWGIPVPGDHRQTIYVWMDALFNYLTVANYTNPTTFSWPPDIQIIGKDILKFHAIFWPAFLFALDLEPPKKIICHSHWTIDSLKMSKSKGNVVDPFDLKDIFSVEGTRYFLLREAVLHHDGNFSLEEMRRTVNNELADKMGNLLSRCCSSSVNPKQIVPRRPSSLSSAARTLLEPFWTMNQVVGQDFSEGHFNLGIEKIMKSIQSLNGYVQDEKPWVLSKNGQTDKLNQVLHVTFEGLRISAILLQPIIPKITKMMLDKMSVPLSDRKWKNACIGLSDTDDRRLSGDRGNVFSRISK